MAPLEWLSETTAWAHTWVPWVDIVWLSSWLAMHGPHVLPSKCSSLESGGSTMSQRRTASAGVRAPRPPSRPLTRRSSANSVPSPYGRTVSELGHRGGGAWGDGADAAAGDRHGRGGRPSTAAPYTRSLGASTSEPGPRPGSTRRASGGRALKLARAADVPLLVRECNKISKRRIASS